jgi:hypothetical protein
MAVYITVVMMGLLATLVQMSQVHHHMLQCLHTTAIRHFTPSDLHVAYDKTQFPEKQSRKLGKKREKITIPYLETDFWKELLEDLHESEKWSLSLLSHNNSDKDEISPRKHGSYIIISQCHRYEAVVKDISNQIQKLSNTWDWNPRARFAILVAGIHKQENSTEQLAADIFADLWLRRVLNVVVMVPTLNVLSNVTGTVPALQLYTWFPYHPPGRCADVRDAFLLDRWVVDSKGKGKFQYNIPLFPNKVPMDFHGCPMRVSVFEFEPSVMKATSASTTYDEGTGIRLLHEIIQKGNMSTLYIEPSHGEHWGYPYGNGSWSGGIGQLIGGQADLLAAYSYYRCHIIKGIECSVPYLIDKIRWYVPCAMPYPRWMSLTRVFTLFLWLSFLAVYIVFAILMWQVVIISSRISSQSTGNHAYTSLVKCLLNLWAVILEQSASNKPPHIAAIRVVFLVWVFFCLSMNTVYQTYLTSFLIDPGLQHQMSSADEVISSGIEYGFPFRWKPFLTDLSGERYSQTHNCKSFKECLNRTMFTHKFAFMGSAVATEYMIAAEFTGNDGKPLVCSFDQIFTFQLALMTVAKGYIFLDHLNSIFLRLMDAGVIEHWFKNIKFSATLASATQMDLQASEYTQLTLLHIQSAFYFLFLGYTFATVVFLLELLGYVKRLACKLK